MAVSVSVRARKLRNVRVLAWVGMGLTLALGFLRVEDTRKDQDAGLCAAINENRRVVLDLVKQTSDELTVPPGAAPELREVIEAARERGRVFKAYAVRVLQPEDCD